ncbi:MAG: hypothetical protein OIN66_01250 [Candidatus Methanoperedens sp.]|nr:hypothetical protein [Candidatus Methanoperedens sp.]
MGKVISRGYDYLTAVNEKRELLTGAVKNIGCGEHNRAREMLQDLVKHLELDSNPGDLKYFIFASALSRRLGTCLADGSNIYLREYEVPQIDLFNMLANRVPLVYMSGYIANELLCKFISGREEIVLVDIGIGTGRQEMDLLKLLAERRAAPGKLVLVGIEPQVSSLQRAEDTLLDLASQLGINLEFHPFAKLIEDFNEEDWNRLKKLPGHLVVNESFALHHVLKTEMKPDPRDEILRRLKQLNPLGFVLSEPHSDHSTDDIWSRFNNCWKHFGLAFSVIDQLDMPDKIKGAIKLNFFGREIEDILGNNDERRCERHETAQMWADRLKKAGFSIWRDFGFASGLSAPVVTVSSKGDYIGLDYKGKTIVSILCGT